MSQFPKLKEYYKLYKEYLEYPENNSKYEQLLKKLSEKTTSREYFLEQSNNNVPCEERSKLHKNIIDTAMGNYKSSKEPPHIHFLLGSIGSGKTSAKDKIVTNKKRKKSFIYINFDEIKKSLPEYDLLKKINPKKAAQFVQSESSKIAGKLFKKSVQTKYNIIFEKNIRKNKEGEIHLISEINRAIKKKYFISIHIVFLDDYDEAWKRVKKRAEEIKRFVPKEQVKETFKDLFPNLNTICDAFPNDSINIYLWYNGIEVDEAILVGFIVIGDYCEMEDRPIMKDLKIEVIQADPLVVIFSRLKVLPEKAIKELKKLNFLKNI